MTKPKKITKKATDPETSSSNVQKPNSAHKIKPFLKNNYKVIVIGIFLISICTLAYGYVHTKNELKRLSDPKTAAQDQAQDLTTKVGKLIVLPSDNNPTIATVKDADKLKAQEFFARAQNGDKILYYPKSSRAVLYRPSSNKVVEYSKVNLNNNQ
jgi:hypothetical protein